MIDNLKSYLELAWKSFNCLVQLFNLFLRWELTVWLCDVSDIDQNARFAIEHNFVALKAHNSRSLLNILCPVVLILILLLENVCLTE